MACDNSNKEISEAQSIHGDVLETILSYVPLIDLAPASHVSKGWNRAVFSSLRHISMPKPWLIVHAQNTRSHVVNATCSYDPRSDIWIEIESGLSINHDTIVRSSDSNLVYTISPSRFSYSMDPFHLTWHNTGPLKVSRVDPIVAAVGRHVIVVGGTYDFEDDPLAVEMYDPDSAMWTTCDPMPESLKHSSASSWVSTATDGSKLFLTEKESGSTHVFDPNTKAWSTLSDPRPDHNISYFITTFVNKRRILIGLIEDADDVKRVKIWGIKGEGLEEIGEMPKEVLETENVSLSSIRVCSGGNFLYIYSNSKLVVCEFVGGGCRWRSVSNAYAMMGGGSVMERVVFSCSEVGINDVDNALRSDNRRFTPIT